jgi:integrase
MKRVDKGIYQRGPDSFQVKLTINGFAVSCTRPTLAEARAYRDSKLASVALDPDAKRVLESRIKKADVKAMTLAKALERYEKAITPNKKGAEVEKGYIRKINRHKIAKQSIYQITGEDVTTFLDSLRRDGSGPQAGKALTGETKRKYASLISSLYEVARRQWHIGVTNPVRDISLPPPCKSRKRRLEPGEEPRLIDALNASRNTAIRTLVQLAIETAMRQGELLKMCWEDIELENDYGTIYLHDTKNGDDRVVPLSAKAVALIHELPRPIGGGRVFPFTKDAVRTTWDFACKRADITGLRFHDLRHEATSRLFELGLDRVEAASITGHKTLQMLKDYTHLRAAKLAQKINQRQAKEAEA